MYRKNIYFIVIATLLFCSGLTYLAVSWHEQHSREIAVGTVSKLRIAVVTWVGHGPFYIAKEKGFYARRGLDVDIQLIEDIGARRSALLSGELDGIISSVDAFAVAASRKLPAKTILELGQSDGGDAIVARKDIATLADLKGRTVAFPRGEPSHFLLYTALSKVGLSTKEIVPEHMTAGDAGAAFVAGKVDASVTWEPWVTEAREKGNGHILVSSKDSSGTLVDIFVVRNDVLVKQPKAVRAFVEGWFEAIRYWEKNTSDANQIMAKALRIPVSDLEGMLMGYKFANHRENMSYFGESGEASRYWEVFGLAIQAWLSEGIIKAPANAAEFTDVSIMRSLIKQ